VSKSAAHYFCSVSAPRHHKVKAGRLAHCLAGYIAGAALVMIIAAGCSTSEPVSLAPKSVRTVEYYPFQVKGYENTYPKRRVAVLAAADARDFRDTSGSAHAPDQGHPAIGVIRDKTGEIDQRIYGPPLEPLVQQSLAQAATEAGFISSVSAMPLKQALAARQADYLMQARIVRFWVNKHRGPDNSAGPTWFASAEVALDVSVYKSPFGVPFWQGESEATYDDPPPPVAGSVPEDETEIYDDPGQVLSVALTRAVAGVFQRDDLHTLITEDSASLK
jgi:hypothetical protein